MIGQELGQLSRVLDPRPVGHRQPQFGELLTHQQLVLGVEQGVGAGVHRDAAFDERPQDLLRHMLVIERDHIDGFGEREHDVAVAVVADLDGGQCGGHAVGLCEHANLDTEIDRRGNHHSGQLAPTNDTNNGRHVFTNFCASFQRAIGLRSGRGCDSVVDCRARRPTSPLYLLSLLVHC